MGASISRRGFAKAAGALALAGSMRGVAQQAPAKLNIAGFDETDAGKVAQKNWQPVSDRRVKVGIAGYGVCRFGAQFGFQNHPNVEVVAATDLDPAKCAELAKVTGARKTYTSCEEMFEKDREIEAVFVATDAPSHVELCIKGLQRGLHMASAVPAIFCEEQLEFADKLLEAVRSSGKIYALFETSAFRPQVYAAREIYRAGGFGEMIYTEGEYYHYTEKHIGSYKGWRIGFPPQYYPTHSNSFYTDVTGGSFLSVTCLGKPSTLPEFQPANNRYKNPFASEIALLRTSEGGMARMAVTWDTPGAHGEKGRMYGQKGFFEEKYAGQAKLEGVAQAKPPLPPGMPAGGHGGSHGYLTEDFITAILLKRQPCVNAAAALNNTVAGIYAHMSAMKDGETLKIPQFKL